MEESQNQDKKKKKKAKQSDSPRVTIAAMAAVISLCSLMLSLFQMYTSREHQYASVRPIMRWISSADINDDGTGRFEIHVSNKGVGPAIVHHIEFVYKGHRYEEWELSKLLPKMAGLPEGEIVYCVYSSITGAVLLTGEDIQMFGVHDKKIAYKIAKEFSRAASNGEFDINICYTDIYDHSWRLHKGLLVSETDACPPLPEK
jgi:hypothetical protein